MTSLTSAEPRRSDLLSGQRHLPLLTVPVPMELLGPALEIGLEGLRARSGIAWERPGAGSALFGFGVAAQVRGRRSSSLGEARLPLAELMRDSAAGAIDPEARPRAFGGGRFAPWGTRKDSRWDAFGGWEFTVPELLVAIAGDQVSASLTMRGGSGPPGGDIRRAVDRLLGEGPDAVPTPTTDTGHSDAPLESGEWQEIVARALQEIGEGRYRKVVLARALDISLTRARTGDILSALAERYPGCFVFKYERAGRAWLGASPELLASVKRGRVEAVCLAGSRPRGAEAVEDDRLANELLSSAKEREEHELVRAAIATGIEPFCVSFEHSATPAVVRMANIQHLRTPFAGTLKAGANVLDIAASLHPTPAVGGSPRAEALEAIDRLEGMDRGWYAGPIGWMDFAGDGEFAVGLRSGLVGPEGARIYAGAGIVAGSNPANEYAETETKLRPLLDSLASALR